MKLYKTCLTIIALCMTIPTFSEEDEHHEDEAEQYSEEREIRERIQEFLEEDEGKEMKEFVQQFFSADSIPMIYQKIEEDPFTAYEWLMHLFEIREEYVELTRFDAEQAKVFIRFQRHEVDTFILSSKLENMMEKRAPSNDISKLREDLKESVAQAFELKLKLQAIELDSLKKEVDELESMLAKRKEAKEEIIERRYQELSGEKEYLEW